MNINLRRIAIILASIMLLSSVLASCDFIPTGDTDSTSESLTENHEESSETDDPTEESEKTEESSSSKEEESSSNGEESSSKEEDSSSNGEESSSNVEEDTRFEKEYAPVYYMDAKTIAKATKDYEWGANQSNMLGGYLSKDKSYVTLIPFDGEQEAYFYLFNTTKKVGPIMVVKYRTKHTGFYMEFFAGSYSDAAQTGCNFKIQGLKTDGEWDVRMIDLNQKLPDVFDGASLRHIRFDCANGDPIPPECELDIAYIAFFDTIEDAQKFEFGEDYGIAK